MNPKIITWSSKYSISIFTIPFISRLIRIYCLYQLVQYHIYIFKAIYIHRINCIDDMDMVNASFIIDRARKSLYPLHLHNIVYQSRIFTDLNLKYSHRNSYNYIYQAPFIHYQSSCPFIVKGEATLENIIIALQVYMCMNVHQKA